MTTCNYLFQKSSNKSRAKGFSLPHFLPVIKQEEEEEEEKGGTRTDFVQRPARGGENRTKNFFEVEKDPDEEFGQRNLVRH